MTTPLSFFVADPTATSGGASARAVAVSDVLLFHTPDGGEIEFVNGAPTMSDGLYTAAYLSLFGGNERDSGLAGGEPLQWWGNLGETQPARIYRSRTQYLLRSLPAIPANLLRIKDAAEEDLGWMLDEFATLVSALVTMPALNRVNLGVNIEIGESKYQFDFTGTWSARSQ